MKDKFKYGSSEIKEMYWGSSSVASVYYGDELIWKKESSEVSTYFYFDGTSVTNSGKPIIISSPTGINKITLKDSNHTMLMVYISEHITPDSQFTTSNYGECLFGVQGAGKGDTPVVIPIINGEQSITLPSGTNGVFINPVYGCNANDSTKFYIRTDGNSDAIIQKLNNTQGALMTTSASVSEMMSPFYNNWDLKFSDLNERAYKG